MDEVDVGSAPAAASGPPVLRFDRTNEVLTAITRPHDPNLYTSCPGSLQANTSSHSLIIQIFLSLVLPLATLALSGTPQAALRTWWQMSSLSCPSKTAPASPIWIGSRDSFPDTLNGAPQLLRIPHHQLAKTASYALDHLGLPAGLKPHSRYYHYASRRPLDADFVIVGNFSHARGSRIAPYKPRCCEVNKLRLSASRLSDSSPPRKTLRYRKMPSPGKVSRRDPSSIQRSRTNLFIRI